MSRVGLEIWFTSYGNGLVLVEKGSYELVGEGNFCGWYGAMKLVHPTIFAELKSWDSEVEIVNDSREVYIREFQEIDCGVLDISDDVKLMEKTRDSKVKEDCMSKTLDNMDKVRKLIQMFNFIMKENNNSDVISCRDLYSILEKYLGI